MTCRSVLGWGQRLHIISAYINWYYLWDNNYGSVWGIHLCNCTVNNVFEAVYRAIIDSSLNHGEDDEYPMFFRGEGRRWPKISFLCVKNTSLLSQILFFSFCRIGVEHLEYCKASEAIACYIFFYVDFLKRSRDVYTQLKYYIYVSQFTVSSSLFWNI